MPLYEFRCPSCTHEFEALVRKDETPRCPTCESPRVEKLLSAAAARVGGTLPITGGCPPPEAGPCGPGCCLLPG
ncbi:MAG TPA: zinc ribbon domain-containing protein [Planctomycetaceae bacterium]